VLFPEKLKYTLPLSAISMAPLNSKVAGTLLVVGGTQFIIALAIAEALYPGYSTANNYISDLGVWGNPSAAVFNPSIIFLGITTLVASVYLKRYFHLGKGFYIYAVGGLGSLGVGLFPENTFVVSGIPILHDLFAILAFVFGGAAALFTYRLAKSPFRYISLILGTISLVAFAVFLGTSSSGSVGLGAGGLERLVAYPTTLGLISFGGYLLAIDTEH
jgi:hypothetical membrane protein